MKVAINTRMLVRGRLEGLGWYTFEVARRLVERHPEWQFLFLFDRRPDPSFVFSPAVTPIHVPPPARHPWLWHAWFELGLPRAFRRYRPDVFLSPDGYLSRRGRVPTALVLHDLAYIHYPGQLPAGVRRFLRREVPRYVARADALLTVSEYSRRDLVRQFALAPADVAVTGNGARPGFRPQPPEARVAARKRYADGRPYFLYLGSVHPRKNVARLIEAFDRFKEHSGAPHRLLIAGADGWKTGEVSAALTRSPFRPHIHRLGYVPEDELPRLLGSATALTYVSLFEGFGVPLLEAMRAEVPILSSRAASLPEVAGDAALLVDPESTDAIARGLRALAADPALRDDLVARGREQRKRFTWEKTTDVVEEALVGLYEKTRRTPDARAR